MIPAQTCVACRVFLNSRARCSAFPESPESAASRCCCRLAPSQLRLGQPSGDTGLSPRGWSSAHWVPGTASQHSACLRAPSRAWPRRPMAQGPRGGVDRSRVLSQFQALRPSSNRFWHWPGSLLRGQLSARPVLVAQGRKSGSSLCPKKKKVDVLIQMAPGRRNSLLLGEGRPFCSGQTFA